MILATRALDANHDWTFGQGKQNYLQERESISQRIKTRLLCLRNDWFMALDYGVDYFSANEAVITKQMQQMIIETNGVVELLSFTYTVDDDRKLSVSAVVRDVYGQEIEVSA